MNYVQKNPSPISKVYVTVSHRDGSSESYTLKDILELDAHTKRKHPDTMVVKVVGELLETEVVPAKDKPTKAFELNKTHEGLWIDYKDIHGFLEEINVVEVSDGRDNWSTSGVFIFVGGREHAIMHNDPIQVKDI